jgi:hypothetical protein
MAEYSKDVSHCIDTRVLDSCGPQSEKNETGSELTTPVNEAVPTIDPKIEKKLLRKIDGYVISLLGVSPCRQ